MTERPFVVALDGPAASGKSSVGQAVAQQLGFLYFDSGLLYRALTAVALQRGIRLDDAAALADLAHTVRLDVRPATIGDGRQVDVLADGADITRSLRSPEVDRGVSPVAAHAEVRAALIEPQRAVVQAPGTVLAGRDIGTVIVPDAALKVWLDASVEERARRRAAQTGEEAAAVREAMRARDLFDGTRVVAPMTRAPDALVVKTDALPLAAVVARIVQLARERMG